MENSKNQENQENQENLKEVDFTTKKIYTETVHLPSGEWVEVRGMKTKEMDILANRKAMKDGEGINEIAKACIVSSSDIFDYDTALQGDRYCIILAIRRITYPGPYQFVVDCPYCSAKKTYKVDLGKLDVKYLDGRPSKGLKFTFPRSGETITYHLPTGEDEKELIKLRKDNKDQLMTLALMTYTDSVDGLRMKKVDFFKDLDAADVVAFQDELSENNCGVETSIDIECGDCEAEFEAELPITMDFFLPKKAKKQ